MCFVFSKGSNETSSVVLEALLFGHILRSRILCHCLEERVQQSVVVLSCMDRLESDMPNARKSKHHRKHWVSPTVETSTWPQINKIILEFRCDGARHSASVVQWNRDDVSLAFNDSFSHRALRSEVSRFTIRNEPISVTHEKQRAVVVDAIESCHLSRGISLDKNHNEVIVNVKPSLYIRLQLSRFWFL